MYTHQAPRVSRGIWIRFMARQILHKEVDEVVTLRVGSTHFHGSLQDLTPTHQKHQNTKFPHKVQPDTSNSYLFLELACGPFCVVVRRCHQRQQQKPRKCFPGLSSPGVNDVTKTMHRSRMESALQALYVHFSIEEKYIHEFAPRAIDAPKCILVFSVQPLQTPRTTTSI
jgi:hypothetical protein